MVFLSWSRCFMIYQTNGAFLWKSGNWNKGYSFNGMKCLLKEKKKKDQGLRVLLWLPRNFYFITITPNLCCDETKPRSTHSPDNYHGILGIQPFKKKQITDFLLTLIIDLCHISPHKAMWVYLLRGDWNGKQSTFSFMSPVSTSK